MKTHKCVFSSKHGSQGDHFGFLMCEHCSTIKIYERPIYLQPIPLGWAVPR